MTLRAARFTVFSLLLTFSVQLLASAVPPCPMLSAGNSLALASVSAPDVRDHAGMDHAAMGHASMVDRVDLPHQSLQAHPVTKSIPMLAMDCCDDSQNCDMAMCLMAPALPSLFHLPSDFSVNAKPVTSAQHVLVLIVDNLYHPPRFA